jgi:hypothetical protein
MKNAEIARSSGNNQSPIFISLQSVYLIWQARKTVYDVCIIKSIEQYYDMLVLSRYLWKTLCLVWHGFHTMFNDDLLRHLSIIKDIILTNWGVPVLVLLMGEIMKYIVEMASGGMTNIPSFMVIGPGIQVILRLKRTVFWDITPCSPLTVNWCFGGTFRLHLQGRENKLSKKAVWQQVASIILGWLLQQL